MAKVMLASDIITKENLAVKIVKKSQLLQDLDDKESILVERRVLEVASGCPFLTDAYATFQTEDHIFFAMQYLRGGDLDDLIKAHDRLDIDTIRDLKPENILLDDNGNVKIADFGLALENMFGDKMATECAGTLGYMAPEMMNDENYNASLDWWGLGVIIYQMATGYHPFRRNPWQTVTRPTEQRYTPHYPEYLSTDTQDIMEKPSLENITGSMSVREALSLTWFTEEPIGSSEQKLFKGFSFNNPKITNLLEPTAAPLCSVKEKNRKRKRVVSGNEEIITKKNRMLELSKPVPAISWAARANNRKRKKGENDKEVHPNIPRTDELSEPLAAATCTNRDLNRKRKKDQSERDSQTISKTQKES
ncbi:protein kinase C delta type-like [Pelobates fuscus]|uniref:protein kinase C delta type-like n=1 Tax=Pelobates fuscus TaxID=191477 RepID=UPI002FE4D444